LDALRYPRAALGEPRAVSTNKREWKI